MKNSYMRKRTSSYRFADMASGVLSVRTQQQAKMYLQDLVNFSKSTDKKGVEAFSKFVEESDFVYQTMYDLDRALVEMYQKNQELQKKRPTDKRITNTNEYKNLTVLFSKVEKTIVMTINKVRPFFNSLGLMIKNFTHYDLVSDGNSIVRAIVDFQKQMQDAIYNLKYVFEFVDELADRITSENTMLANEEIDTGLGGWFRRKFMKNSALTLKDQLTEKLAKITPSLNNLYVLMVDPSQIGMGVQTYLHYLTCENSFRQLLNMRVPTEDAEVWDSNIKPVIMKYAKGNYFSQSKHGILNLEKVAVDLGFIFTVKNKAKDFVSEMGNLMGV